MCCRRCLLFFSLLVLPFALGAAENAAAPVPPVSTYSLDTYAAVGSFFAQNTRLADLGWDEGEFNAFVEGLRATFRGKPYPFDERARRLHEAIGQRLQQLAAREARMPVLDFSAPAQLDAYMKDMAKKFHLQFSDDGLAYALRGNGNIRPGPDDTVVLSYEVVAADGQTELPSLSVQQLRTQVSALLPGLAEGVQLMTDSGSGLFLLPPDLAFGAGQWPAGVAKAPLIITVTLHEIVAAP